MIAIKIDSHYEHFSRYNVIAMCGGFDEESKQLYVVSAQKAEGESITSLEAEAAASIEVIVYVVPSMLPQGKNEPIDHHAPFEIELSIKSRNKQIYKRIHEVNAWGGTAIKLNFNEL